MSALANQPTTASLLQTTCTAASEEDDRHVSAATDNEESECAIAFQSLLTKPPILDNLLLHLPTGSLFDLYHTNKFVRLLLRDYPLAWKNLSFRLLPAPPPASNASGVDSPAESNASKRPHALDFLLRFGLPPKTKIRLTRLDLDNTSVSGTELHTNILHPLRSVLKHLSVRGCKEVSIKYHILPFLTTSLIVPADLNDEPLALKSLYTYRCRHHRRRPYLPSSLSRRDSDSHPTHQLIEICHRFKIWTDTAWCPTSGGRCFRRKDYWIGRSGFGASEVWVPFDRLWRSQNFLGTTEDLQETRGRERYNRRDADSGSVGRLWDEHECGYGGEALGSGITNNEDGKELPTHERRSHKAFVEGFQCYACGDQILERCEQCSVRMHCAGCRKTLCHSCAFDRPVRKKRRRGVEAAADMTASISSLEAPTVDAGPAARRRRRRQNERYWWAPGATRSPNIMSESNQSDESSSDEDSSSQSERPTSNPRLDMHWCCLKPTFSGGGGIGFIGTPNGDNVRAAPLPQGQGFEDVDFPLRIVKTKDEGSASQRSQSPASENSAGESSQAQSHSSCSSVSSPPVNSADAALFTTLSSPLSPHQNITQPHKAPRSLCAECYNSSKWRVTCKACNLPICIEHDIKQLKARRCGFRKLDQERKVVQQVQNLRRGEQAVAHGLRDANLRIFLAKWRPIVAGMEAIDEKRRSERKWVPADHDVDPADDPISPISPFTDAPSKAISIRRTKSLTVLPSHTHSSKPGLSISPPSATPPRTSTPRWLGCGAFFCPSPRTLGDPRPRCTATETSNAVAASSPTHQPGTNAVSTVTATTNFATHVANHHPHAMPFVANMGALGNMTLAPGTTMTFLYGPGFATNQPAQAQPQPNQPAQQALPPLPGPPHHQLQAAMQNQLPGNLNGNPHPAPTHANQLSAIIAHAAGPQQHVRGGVIHTSTGQNDHEALRCAGCNVLVCGDCRRESRCCPCSACSPALTSASYAQAATGTNAAAVPGHGATNTQPAPANASTAQPSSTSTSPPPPTIDQFAAQQLCPNCRSHPTIQSRCRFALETSKALELMSQASLSSNASSGSSDSAASASYEEDDEVGKMVDDGSWSDFWATLGEEPVPATDDVASNAALAEMDGAGVDANHTTPPPAPVQLAPPTLDVEPEVDGAELEAAVDELIADVEGEEGGDGDVSSAEGTVEGLDDVELEEDVMGMEG